ncbi:Cobinamide kinase/cobinamide phosphate guanyltransferase [Chytridium lagenaria]|nr:Cobinamide kinase/cobinamide phosphate guanyltransferase [Chytridium lagenaria]
MGDARIILLVGGARSGKSAFAERLASTAQTPIVYIATARPSDAEMSARIDRHKQDRQTGANSTTPASWLTIEEPLDLSKVSLPSSHRTVVVDCLTVWLGNWMKRYGYYPSEDVDEKAVLWAKGFDETAREEVGKFIDRMVEEGRTVLIVSNEVGLGIVPMYMASRHYRDTLGRINQDVGKRAEKVYWMVAGFAVDVKKLDAEATL